MATEKEMGELLGKAMADADFRARLLEDPIRAAGDLGMNLTEDQIAGIRTSNLAHGPEGLDERLSKRLR